MAITRKDITNRIDCIGEDGNKYTVFEITEFVDATVFEGKPEEEEGFKEFRLTDGAAVNRISDSEFEVVSTGIKLKENG